MWTVYINKYFEPRKFYFLKIIVRKCKENKIKLKVNGQQALLN